MKILSIFVLLAAIASIGFFVLRDNFTSAPEPVSQIPAEEIYQGTSYRAVNAKDFEVNIFASNLISPTRIKFTPDGKYMLVTQITGQLLGFARSESGWSDKPFTVTSIDPRFPGFPPDEAGLVGLEFSREFAENGKIFLLYTYKDKDGTTKNRISTTTVIERNGQLIGTRPTLLFEANIAGTGSHQITDAVSLMYEGKPHLLFLIGEGFDGKRAQDPSLEGGKVMLISEDGSNKKTVALGLRNGYVFAKNPWDNRFLISDTGPDKYDRLIYSYLGENSEDLNFGWNGEEEKLGEKIPDPNNKNVTDMVIMRLPQTQTFTGIIFHPGKGKILESDDKAQSVIVTMFGKTGSNKNKPGKEIRLGRLTNLSGQPRITFETIVERVPQAEGKLGNPIGLAMDPLTHDLVFADVLEGRIYQILVKGGEK